MRVALKFAYDGARFFGYARQPHQITVEGELLQFLIKNNSIDDVKKSCFRTASRTDKGVSALGNVCSFNTAVSQREIMRKFAEATSDIFAYGIQQVSSDFFPRYAKQRQYRYYLKRGCLDSEAVISAAALFAGEHDFSNFARVESGKDPIRVIDNIIIQEAEEFFVIDFFAQTFLWNQIRRIVSALAKAGAGKLSRTEIKQALDHPEMKVDFQLAPPQPLILMDVVYDFSFEYIRGYIKKQQMFENKIVSFLCDSI